MKQKAMKRTKLTQMSLQKETKKTKQILFVKESSFTLLSSVEPFFDQEILQKEKKGTKSAGIL